MKVLLSGGGTGGHVYPAICIGRAVERLENRTELLFVGTEKGMENEIVPREGIPMKFIKIRGLKRSLSLENFNAVKEMFQSLHESRKLIREFRPDVVIGTGGYVCGPVLLAAALEKVPTLIHEQNAIPGITNKVLSKFVKRVAVTYPGTEGHFAHKDRVIYTGNPIREGFRAVTREEGLEALGLRKDIPLILVTGGSLGARKINRAMGRLAVDAIKTDGYQILHVTGKNTLEEIQTYYRELGIKDFESGNLRVMPYLNQMAEALSAADIVISRAGAGILAEIAVTGCPAILVPYPFAANNHQEMNAKAYEKVGGGQVLLEKDLTEDSLYETVMALLDSPSKREQMKKLGRESGKPESADVIAKEVQALIEHSRRTK